MEGQGTEGPRSHRADEFRAKRTKIPQNHTYNYDIKSIDEIKAINQQIYLNLNHLFIAQVSK